MHKFNALISSYYNYKVKYIFKNSSPLLNIPFDQFGRKSFNFLHEKRKSFFSAQKEKFAIDAIEFDLNTIRVHNGIEVTKNDPLCLLGLEADLALHERSHVLAGTKQGTDRYLYCF